MFDYLMLLLMFLAGWWLSRYRYLSQSKSQEKEWQLQLRHHSDLVVESETQLVEERRIVREMAKWVYLEKLKVQDSAMALQKAMLRQSELEMALDLAHSKAMVTQKALEWDLQ